MKKKILTLAAVTALFVTAASAQEKGKLNPGGIYIKGGYNSANISTKSDGSVHDSRSLGTFHAGVIADLPIADIFSFQTGLLLNGKGAKADYYADPNNQSDNYVKTRFNPLYLELPANFLVKFPIGNDLRIYAGAGPYVAMGIGGKSKAEISVLGEKTTTSESIKFNNDDPTTGEQEGARFDRLKRFDVGLNALAGVETNRLMLGLNYGWGLTKINSTQTNNSDDKNKYRTLSLSLGVRLL
ncbi:porin family protein [Foetidibacter luteolus]|uniref:porin family protein n=1 Tax=Foetidibacter luteolus TaxID=2608880 RepID=UPI001A97DE1B|nr:porin family protein [Foetidibacter luteolus]